MKPGFALSLSPDGISLLYRAAGGWRLVGNVALDSSDLGAALANLRAQAERLSPGPITSKLIIPNSQIRYLTLDTGMVEDMIRVDMARAALDGVTPYPVNELAFDLSLDGPLTHVAAVAIETLDEAETFASNHGFGPTSFVAAPGDVDFLGEPFFGTARAVRGIEVEPDGAAVVNIGPAEFPETTTEAPVAPAPKTDGLNNSVASDVVPGPVVGFSSRRHRPDAAAPSLQDRPNPPLVDQPAKPAPMSDTAAQPPLVSSTSETPPTPTQISAPSVTGPDEDVVTATPVATPDNAAFSSRRQTLPAANVVQQTRPVVEIAPTASAVPTSAAVKDNLRNNPFAAPDAIDVGGKPRFLGLMLIAALLLVMAAVATWAVYTKGTIFPFGQDETLPEVTQTTVPIEQPPPITLPEVAPTPPVPAVATTSDQQPRIIEPQVSALPENLSVLAIPPATEVTQPPALSGTDAAVLDALRQPEHTDLNPESLAGAIEETPSGQPPEPSQTAQPAIAGIWQNVPGVPEPPALIGLDNIYVASIDNTELSQDAVALPPPISFSTDTELDMVTSPVAAGKAFDLDERGLVRATPEGTLNPDGIMVYLGRPVRVPPPTPNRPDPVAEAQIDEQQTVLARLRPRLRPDNLVEQTERAQLGGLSLAELGQKRPRPRPPSSRPANENSLPATEQAIATSKPPKARPVNFANLVDRAQRNTDNRPASAAASTAGILTSTTPAAVAPETVTPSIPSSASVARQATMENSINLRKINLIGVYGTPSNRRALVRLSSGRYKKVKVGDRIDGGQVVAIGDTELRYQKGGRNVTLKIPNG